MNNQSKIVALIIIKDFISKQNLPAFILLLLICITGIINISLTYHTRILHNQENQLQIANKNLEDDFINLQLEQNLQSNKKRVLQTADKLKLEPIKPKQEIIIVQ